MRYRVYRRFLDPPSPLDPPDPLDPLDPLDPFDPLDPLDPLLEPIEPGPVVPLDLPKPLEPFPFAPFEPPEPFEPRGMQAGGGADGLNEEVGGPEYDDGTAAPA